jgi:hypothetical protein
MELNYGKQYKRRCASCGEDFISICEVRTNFNGTVNERFPRTCPKCEEAYDMGLEC